MKPTHTHMGAYGPRRQKSEVNTDGIASGTANTRHRRSAPDPEVTAEFTADAASVVVTHRAFGIGRHTDTPRDPKGGWLGWLPFRGVYR
jgi:hypothetical protein